MQQGQPIKVLHGKNLLMYTYEKELLALVNCVQLWRQYLHGRRFVVHTDHASLRFLFQQKIHSIAQQRWLYKLMGYDFSIEYKKCLVNSAPDALSRVCENNPLLPISQPNLVWLDTIRYEIKI